MSEIPPREVILAFCENGAHDIHVEPLGRGNINDTYLVRCSHRSLVLQRIAANVFADPATVIQNFVRVSEHLIRTKVAEGLPFIVASPVFNRQGKSLVRDTDGNCWRAQSFLAHQQLVSISTPGQALSAGQTLAMFHYLLRDIEGAEIKDPLPDFHNLQFYLTLFDKVWAGRQGEASVAEEKCLAVIDRYRERADTLERARREGLLSLRPVHGDPKIDNFVFNHEGLAVGMLDLDTVRFGLVHHDLGDCLRSTCNRAGEGGRTADVSFDMDLCAAILKGYFSGPGAPMPFAQRELIFDGLLLICYELGIRFFTDYLLGNSYFKVTYEGENLVRTINQFRLVDQLDRHELEMRKRISAIS